MDRLDFDQTVLDAILHLHKVNMDMQSQLEHLKDKETAWAMEKEELTTRIENLENNRIASEQTALFVQWVKKKIGLKLYIKSVDYIASNKQKQIIITLSNFQKVRDILANYLQKFNERKFPAPAAHYPNLRFIELLNWSKKYKLVIV